MKLRTIIFAALALIPVAASPHDDAHKGMMRGMMPGMMHGEAEGGHSGDGGHAQAVGKAGDPKKVSRAIQVVMSDDMQFTKAGTVDFACVQPGHFEASMMGTVSVK